MSKQGWKWIIAFNYSFICVQVCALSQTVATTFGLFVIFMEEQPGARGSIYQEKRKKKRKRVILCRRNNHHSFLVTRGAECKRRQRRLPAYGSVWILFSPPTEKSDVTHPLFCHPLPPPKPPLVSPNIFFLQLLELMLSLDYWIL